MESEIRKIFAERLKELRLERGLSCKGLSKQVGISQPSLCRWENCQADVFSYQLVKLANYFGVTTDYLLGLEN